MLLSHTQLLPSESSLHLLSPFISPSPLLSLFLHPYISISLYFRCVDFYEIIENKRLGKGSYGSVYLCKHRKTGDEFACKVSQYFWLRSFSFFAVIFFIIAGLHAINYSRKLA